MLVQCTRTKGSRAEKHKAKFRNVHHQPTGIIKKNQTNLNDGGESIYKYKSAYQDKNALGGSGLREGSRGDISSVIMLNPLLVPVQDEEHGATGPKHEHETQNVRG